MTKARSSSSSVMRMRSLMGALHGQDGGGGGKLDDKGRLRNTVALDVQPAVMSLDDLPRDGEPQSCAPRFGGEKRVEDALLDLAGNARAGVLDHDANVLASIGLHTNPDRAVRRHGFQRIVDQVGEHFGEPEWIAPHRWHGIGVAALDVETPIARTR